MLQKALQGGLLCANDTELSETTQKIVTQLLFSEIDCESTAKIPDEFFTEEYLKGFTLIYVSFTSFQASVHLKSNQMNGFVCTTSMHSFKSAYSEYCLPTDYNFMFKVRVV